MKVKKFIEMLHKEDPTGEAELLVGKSDIFCLEWKPGYYDGAYTRLVRDESKLPYCDVVGAEYRSDGEQLCIRSMDWTDVLGDDPEAPITVVDHFLTKCMQAKVDKFREEMRTIYRELYINAFDTVMQRVQEGWSIRQKSTDLITKCHCQEFFKDGKTERLNQGQCVVVTQKNRFIAVIDDANPEYIYWRLK